MDWTSWFFIVALASVCPRSTTANTGKGNETAAKK
jgi:hypothetical protein